MRRHDGALMWTVQQLRTQVLNSALWPLAHGTVRNWQGSVVPDTAVTVPRLRAHSSVFILSV